ncbi:MAG: radical SAM protein, partial [Candidatus Diapherotrites archaeon]|nr:radical SAM protein [Candidatus Diapherotrites archaeon]
MHYKIRNSRSIGFLNKKKAELTYVKDKVSKAKDIDKTIQSGILKNLKTIMGNQEVEWLSKNGEDRVVEYLIHRYKFKIYPKMKILAPFPLYLLIEPTSICNLNCVMCFQQDSFFREKENLGTIDFEFFKSLVDQAIENDCKALTMASRGEPTLHKEFGRMLRYCKGKFLELKINTNATMLDEKTSRGILEAGADIVVFSIGSSRPEEYKKIQVGGKFEAVLENIKRFNEMRNSKRECNKTSLRVSGVYLGVQNKKDFLA